MDFDRILAQVLDIAHFPDSEKDAFTKSFYQHLFQRLFDEISNVDSASAQELFSAAQREDAGPQEVERVLGQISLNPKVKEKISQTVKEVVGELVDDIATGATEEEKQKILAFLPA